MALEYFFCCNCVLAALRQFYVGIYTNLRIMLLIYLKNCINASPFVYTAFLESTLLAFPSHFLFHTVFVCIECMIQLALTLPTKQNPRTCARARALLVSGFFIFFFILLRLKIAYIRKHTQNYQIYI